MHIEVHVGFAVKFFSGLRYQNALMSSFRLGVRGFGIPSHRVQAKVSSSRGFTLRPEP